MTNNPLVCDLETGVCGVADDEVMEIIDMNEPVEKTDVYYVTDPICSHCWALEPVLHKFKAQYGSYVNLHTVMGGLLEKWGDGFADVKNGIAAPSDVAGHWKEVGEHTRMPIDGSLWLDDPIQSSYPPSRVYKVIQQQDEQLAVKFLRKAREAVFAFNRNIGDDRVLIELVDKLGLDGRHVVAEANSTRGEQLLAEDFLLAGKLGVRGFPTIIMVNAEQKGMKIVGARSLEHYVEALKQTRSASVEVNPTSPPALTQFLDQEELLFSKELEVMYDKERNEIASLIQQELPPESYERKEILGEVYITKK